MKQKTVEDFKKENELTDEMIKTLHDFYISPWNQFKNLSFIDFLYFIKDYEGSTIYTEILEDYADM